METGFTQPLLYALQILDPKLDFDFICHDSSLSANFECLAQPIAPRAPRVAYNSERHMTGVNDPSSRASIEPDVHLSFAIVNSIATWGQMNRLFKTTAAITLAGCSLPTSMPAQSNPSSSQTHEAPAWVKRSDQNAQILLKVLADLSPEGAGQLGVEGVDEKISDFSPGANQRAPYPSSLRRLPSCSPVWRRKKILSSSRICTY